MMILPQRIIMGKIYLWSWFVLVINFIHIK